MLPQISDKTFFMDPLHLTIDILFFMFLVGFAAGLIDSVAGGGGLIALPALLFIGLPPQIALGTNKLQGSFGTLAASYNYIKNGQASFKGALPGIMFTLTGATAGACLVQKLDPTFIEPIIPVLLLVVFIYTLFSKKLGFSDRKPRMHTTVFYMFFGFGLGFYDGFFGPGTGSFWTVSLMLFLGYNMTRATGYTKIMNFISNIVALFWFIIGGNVYFKIGLTMAAGQIIGARIGSNLAITKGTQFIRPVFLTVVLLTIIKLLYTNLIGEA